ncbi:MAG TPA: hypothetical protein VGR11_15080 [Solirubrobacteraceae bacterium]|nr:hypothetical protein [Solirubrobacteraceae bacterium]
MKKFVEKIRTSIKVPAIKPLYLIIAVVVIVVLIIIGVVLTGDSDDDIGGGGGGDDGSDAARGFAEGDRSRLPGADTRPRRQAPRVRTGLVDEARREGRLAVAQARGTIVSPSAVRVRVSSAPKQVVWVTWQLGCYKGRKAHVGQGRYEAQTPNTRPIKLPVQGAESCIATVSAQLTRLNTKGRIKVAVLAGG